MFNNWELKLLLAWQIKCCLNKSNHRDGPWGNKRKYALLDMLCQGFFIFGEVNEKGFALILATDGGGGGKKDVDTYHNYTRYVEAYTTRYNSISWC